MALKIFFCIPSYRWSTRMTAGAWMCRSSVSYTGRLSSGRLTMPGTAVGQLSSLSSAFSCTRVSLYSRATQPLQVGVYRYRLVDRGLPVIALIQRLRANIVDLLYLLRARYTCLTSERSSDGSVDISKKSWSPISVLWISASVIGAVDISFLCIGDGWNIGNLCIFYHTFDF